MVSAVVVVVGFDFLRLSTILIEFDFVMNS